MQAMQVMQVMQVMRVMQVIESIQRPFLVAKFATCKWRHLVAKFEVYASGAIWWSNLQLMQVAPSGGQICDKWKWCYIVAKFNPSHRVNFWVRCASGNVLTEAQVSPTI